MVKKDYQSRLSSRKAQGNNSAFLSIHWLLIFTSLVVIVLSIQILGFNKSEKADSAPAGIANSKMTKVSFGASSSENTQTTAFHKPTKALPEMKAAEPEAEWKSVKVKSGDNLTFIFKRLNLDMGLLRNILNISSVRKKLSPIVPGKEFKVLLSEDGKFHELRYELSLTDTLIVSNTDKGLKHSVEKLPLEKRVEYAQGEINSSLFIAASRAGLPDKVTMELVNIFAWDIDFIHDIRPNDSFKVLYESHYINGEKVRTGQILAAEFVNRNQSHQAIYHETANGKGGYYTPEGLSLKKAFIRAPLNFTRISSKFDLQRRHPILHKIRAHRGVDYAAPRGTPVKAAGDGKVIFVGRKGGYGNTIILQHGNQYRTLYAHLSRFNKRTKKHRQVKQGDIIGYVGTTGLSTGPHLHYEFHVNGKHRDPLTVKLPQASPIKHAEKNEFLQMARARLSLMEQYANTQIVMRDNESNQVSN